ncbi:MAG: hypothetical protein WAU24_05330 [Chitinophagaceae bacterium]
MKKFICFCLIFVSCNQAQKDEHEEAAKEIMAADTAMNNLAVKEGFHKALLLYADDSVLKPSEGELPVIGKTSLEKYWGGANDLKTISWYPTRAEAASSGDLGYTFGNWTLQTEDTIMYGNYCTVWKKQPGGKWKFVFDGGNNTPAPLH